MPKLPTVSGKEMLRFLAKRGFYVDRTSGSHNILKHPDRPELRVTVAVHDKRDIPTGTLRSILRQADISVEELLAEL